MIMKNVNKILVNSNIDINNSINDLTTKDSKILLNVYGESIIYIVNQNIENLVINMKDNSKLDIYIYNVCKLKYIEINQTSNSSINFNYSYVNEEDNYLEVVNNIEDDNNKTNILIKNISNNGLSSIVVRANINKSSKDNYLSESVKGIITHGYIEIDPIIVCDSNEVEANHSATISGLDTEQVNYLMSKGLSEKLSSELVMNGFIKSNMDDYIKEFYN